MVRRPDRRALVLGSTQPWSDVHAERAARWDTEVLRRRSGGGAVLVEPGAVVWLDVWVPASDPLWDDDVLRAAAWVGRWWAAALASVGVDGAAVHRGRAARDPLSALVCFAGRAAGEVTVGGRKVVGVAQWRSRQGALFQTMAHRQWDPAALLHLLVVPPGAADAVAALPGAAVGVAELGVPAGVAALEAALLEGLPPGAWLRPEEGATGG